MNFLSRLITTVTAVITLACPVLAQDAKQASDAKDDIGVASITKTWRVDYVVDADGRMTETFSSVYQVLKPSALENFKVFSLTFSSGVQTGELLEAYTLKKDGRRIDAPPGNYQTEVNGGHKDAGPVFSDQTRLSVVYPDLEVGDSIGMRYRFTEKEPMFPGQFSKLVTFSPYTVYEDAHITLKLPTGMKLLSQANFLQVLPATASGDSQVLEWHYQQAKPRKWDQEQDTGIWRVDEYPSLLLSTFPNYEAIAAAYGARALPKAVPTPRVRELAQQIVGAETAPRKRAQLVYEWVSKNLTYGGNCIGVGAVVPRDLDVVLDNKMGDCKDHATLLQALLAALDIPSEQVLINAGSEYDLAATPVVSLVNHVINYLPDFKLYLDATAKEVPFGMLPMEDSGKPVIHVGRTQALANTPNQQPDRQVQRLNMKLKVAADGKASGALQVSLTGLQAAGARAFMRNLSPEGERDFAKRALAAYGYKGTGTLAKGDTAGLGEQYAYSVQFDIDNFQETAAKGAFVLAPVMGSPLPIMSFATVNARPTMHRRHTCYGFHTYETLELEFAPGLNLQNIPANQRIKGSIIDYVATYQRTKTGIKVARELHDKTTQTVCSPAESAELVKQALPMAENLRTQVIYQRKPAPTTKANSKAQS